MSTKIRLTRGGRKKIPYYTVVVADSRSARDGKFIEKIGKYNPLLKSDDENRFIINKERAEYWLSVGSQPSERLAILMIKAGIKGAEKYKPVFIPKQKKVKEKEVKAEEAQKVEEVSATEEAPAEKAPATEEAPKVEEAPVVETQVDETPIVKEKPAAEEAPAEAPKEEEKPAEEAPKAE